MKGFTPISATRWFFNTLRNHFFFFSFLAFCSRRGASVAAGAESAISFSAARTPQQKSCRISHAAASEADENMRAAFVVCSSAARHPFSWEHNWGRTKAAALSLVLVRDSCFLLSAAPRPRRVYVAERSLAARTRPRLSLRARNRCRRLRAPSVLGPGAGTCCRRWKVGRIDRHPSRYHTRGVSPPCVRREWSGSRSIMRRGKYVNGIALEASSRKKKNGVLVCHKIR